MDVVIAPLAEYSFGERQGIAPYPPVTRSGRLSVRRHEDISGTVDQPVTRPGYILAVAGVVAVEWSVAVEIVVGCLGNSAGMANLVIVADNT